MEHLPQNGCSTAASPPGSVSDFLAAPQGLADTRLGQLLAHAGVAQQRGAPNGTWSNGILKPAVFQLLKFEPRPFFSAGFRSEPRTSQEQKSKDIRKHGPHWHPSRSTLPPTLTLCLERGHVHFHVDGRVSQITQRLPALTQAIHKPTPANSRAKPSVGGG